MTAVTWLAFVLAAGVGAPARYALDRSVQQRWRTAFPWGTFAVNVTGCLALGVLTGLAMYHGLSTSTKLALGTGGLGAYTTFSTFAFESVRLWEEGSRRAAVRNVVATAVVGLLAASAGMALTAIW